MCEFSIRAFYFATFTLAAKGYLANQIGNKMLTSLPLTAALFYTNDILAIIKASVK